MFTATRITRVRHKNLENQSRSIREKKLRWY